MVSQRETEPLTCTVVRVSRPDTVLIRTYCPQIQSMISIYLVLEGIECQPSSQSAIEDWCELHSENDRLRLSTWNYFRDQYGRVMGDLSDLSSGERLSDHLREIGLATERPDHYLEIFRECHD